MDTSRCIASIVARNEPLSIEEEIKLTELVLGMIEPHLRSVTPEHIGHINLSGREKGGGRIHGHSLYEDLSGIANTVSDFKTILETRGFFFRSQPKVWADKLPRRAYYGIDRDGKWLAGLIQLDRMVDISQIECEKAISVDLERLKSPSELVDPKSRYGPAQLTYRSLQGALLSIAEDIVKEREEQFRESQLLKRRFELVSTVLSCIPKPLEPEMP